MVRNHMLDKGSWVGQGCQIEDRGDSGRSLAKRRLDVFKHVHKKLSLNQS